MHALEQVSDVIRAFQLAMVILLTKIVSNINLKTLAILAQRLIGLLDGIQDVSLQMDTVLIDICSLLFLRNSFRKSFCKLLSKHLWQILFSIKFHALSIVLWTPLNKYVWCMKIIVWGAYYLDIKITIRLHCKSHYKVSLQRLLMDAQLKQNLQFFFR